MMQMSHNAFEESYQRLNPAQKEAVDAIEGPVMVVAGPGTGKTEILTLRIANIILKTDTPPEGILVLTFTESGAATMRRRLAEFIGRDAYRVRIATFHSFTNDVIQRHPDEFPNIVGSVSLTEVDHVRVLRDIIDTMELDLFRPFGSPYFYLRAIKSALQTIKREGCSPAEFLALVREEEREFQTIPDLHHASGAHAGKMKVKYADLERSIKKNLELARIYDEYERTLRASHYYDFDDMILETMRAMERDENLLRALQEQYLYFLVDEHQDTNNAQNRIIELLASFYDMPNLFMVGDPRQAIFRFQGASLANFEYFRTRFKDVKFIALTENYRSTQPILDAAFALGKRQDAPLIAAAGAGETIAVYPFASALAEAYFVADEIACRIAEGVSPDEIAVLYRDNRDVVPYARALEKRGVPFAIQAEQNALDDEDIRGFLAVLRMVQHFGEPADLVPGLYMRHLFGLDPLDVHKLFQFASRASREEGRAVDAYDVMRSRAFLERAGVAEPEKFLTLYTTLASWHERAKWSDPAATFERIVRESGMLAHVLTHPSAPEKLAKLHALFDQVKAMVERDRGAALDDFFEYLDLVREHNVAITGSVVAIPGRVRLMTAHKSKGQEFLHVFIVNAIDGKWGFRKHGDKLKLPERLYRVRKETEKGMAEVSEDDERNLFYVALTRAKRGVAITFAKRNQEGREQLPTAFIEEIKPDLRETKATTSFEEEFAKRGEGDFADAGSLVPLLAEKKFLKARFIEQGLSVTALDNYLECPWKYFFVNLVRIPEAPNKHLLYGTAVHAALRSFFKALAEGENKGTSYLVQHFEHMLAMQPMEAKDYEEALKKGRAALQGYYKEYHATWPRRIILEENIEGIELAPDIAIKGRIDKIEILDDASHVNVVDYKTGRPKSKNEIEGKTKSSDGNYKRQLVFYKLLLDRYRDGKFRVVSGTIDFVEPDTRGKYHKEAFAITDEEVKELEALTVRTGQEILSLAFWDRTCGDEACEYCALRKMMTGSGTPIPALTAEAGEREGAPQEQR